MTTRDQAPVGAPCWVDLWTSDVEGSRRFYCELFGWEAGEPSPEFGGYFMFLRDGTPIAGAMGAMGELRANDTWKVYLATDDIAKTVEQAQAEGATVSSPVMTVADHGSQAVIVDPTGAEDGVWQPETFPGLTVIGEPGAPSWFEVASGDFDTAVAFYRSVFGWETNDLSVAGQFRYMTMRSPAGGLDLAGVMDTSRSGDPAPGAWAVYWMTEDVDGSTERVLALGGSVSQPPVDTPYGRIASVADPSGGVFKLHHPNR